MVLFTSVKKAKEVFKEFPKTKDAKTFKQHQHSFWSALYSYSLMILMLKSCQSHVLVLFSDVMDGFGSSFSPHFSACMLMASNKSSNNTVMRESVLAIVLLNDVSLEFAKSFLTAS
jgi:hypothetical protein